MKNTIIAIALAVGIALPMLGTAPASADPGYRVESSTVSLYRHSYSRGGVICTVTKGAYIQRKGRNWSRWIYATYKPDAHYSRVPRSCSGWIDKRSLRPAVTVRTGSVSGL